MTWRPVRTVTVCSLIQSFHMYSSCGGRVLAWHVTAVNRCVSHYWRKKSFSLKKTFSLKTHLFHSFKGSFFFINIFSLVFSQPIASLLQLITAAYNTLQSRQKSRYLLKDWKSGSAFESLCGIVPQSHYDVNDSHGNWFVALLTKHLFSCRCAIGTQLEGFLAFQNIAFWSLSIWCWL